MKIARVLPTFFFASLASVAFAEVQTFDFKDPKGVNNVTFVLDAPLESISGTASGISGTVTYDPENPEATEGKIVVDSESLHVPNPMMKDHMHGEKWLDVKKYPEISFELKELSDIQKTENGGTANATGTFTLHGVSKEITVPVKVTYLPGRLKDRMPNAEGDLLVIRSDFTIKRSDFDIQPGQNEDKVSDEIKISMAIAGAAPKS